MIGDGDIDCDSCWSASTKRYRISMLSSSVIGKLAYETPF